MTLKDRIPDYLVGRYQLTSTVVFTSLFSLVFILIMYPYSKGAWFSLGFSNRASLLTIIFMFCALVVLIASKRLMYGFTRRRELRLWAYILWCACECMIISVIYAFFSREGEAMGIIRIAGNTSFGSLFFSALWVCIVCLGITYLVAGLYFDIEDKNNTIKLMSFSSIATDEKTSPATDKKITLYDNSGSLKLVVSTSNLYYIESDDNYIKVWYVDATGALKQYMLRCRLKTVEESFADSDLVRCHRKYIVNIQKIEVLSRGKDGYQIDLGLENTSPIPVSKTYEDNILERFNTRNR